RLNHCRDSRLMEHFYPAVEMFDQGRASLDPVTTVVIRYASKFADRRAVNVPAQHRINVISLGVFHHRGFELADEAHRIFDSLFHISAERPITAAEPPPDEIDERIKREQKLV